MPQIRRPGMFGCATTLRVDPRSMAAGRAAWLPALWGALVACACGLTPLGTAAAENAAAAPQAPPRSLSHPSTGSTLEHRVKVLSKALDLDAQQQAELRKIFESQRAAVTKIWTDPALIYAERVPAIRALEDRTANAIRSILNDAQKKRYNPPKPQAAPSAPPDVAAWMETARTRQR